MSPPDVSQAKAAQVCGVSTATIRRARVAGRLDGVRKAADGSGWLIPIPSLVAAGLLDRVSPPDTVTPRTVSPDTTPPVTPPVTPPDMVPLREVEDLRRRLAVAEALADERARSLEDLRVSMRMLAAAPPARAPEKRRWWSR